ncbi:MAG TPA: hypothetical protein V6D22_11100 [Candidatus Obscuribacterales bacterium]
MTAQQRDPDSSKDADSIDAVIDLYKKDIDRTLIRENLKLSVQQRFDKFAEFMKLADELKRAGKAQRQ